MRVLVIAYEFPPSPSPQSLRWKYLSGELAALGVDVHVLTVEPVATTAPEALPGVTVHRAFPGMVVGGIARLARWRRARGRDGGVPAPEGAAGAAPVVSMPARLNWKGRLLKHIQQLAAYVYFPDLRGEWRPFARRRLVRLLDELRPDVVVSSHEPATTLQLGAIAKRRGFAWCADLGDPVLCFYTERRWRRRALRLERHVCRRADCITVTTAGAKALLEQRHGTPPCRVHVVSQGFDARLDRSSTRLLFDPDRLELLFTGSFYHFRRPDTLFEALASITDGVRLNVATSRVPPALEHWFATHPERFRLLGFLPHGEALAAQRAADVLVNIANDDPVHLPGKVFEYLGARRPILHVGERDDDAAASLIRERGCGWAVSHRSDELAAAVERLARMKREHALDAAFSLGEEGLEAYSWQGLGQRLADLLRATAEAR